MTTLSNGASPALPLPYDINFDTTPEELARELKLAESLIYTEDTPTKTREAFIKAKSRKDKNEAKKARDYFKCHMQEAADTWHAMAGGINLAYRSDNDLKRLAAQLAKARTRSTIETMLATSTKNAELKSDRGNWLHSATEEEIESWLNSISKASDGEPEKSEAVKSAIKEAKDFLAEHTFCTDHEKKTAELNPTQIRQWHKTADSKNNLTRATDKGFHLRKLRLQCRHDTAKAELPLVVAKRSTVTDIMTKSRTDQVKRNEQILGQTTMTSAAGSVNLLDIVKGSLANPLLRFYDLKQKLGGTVEIAKAMGMAVTMETITCPSRMHPGSDKYDGTTPKEAQKYLAEKWALFRARVSKDRSKGFQAVGYRFVEAHKDACPHWHVLICTNDLLEVRHHIKVLYLLAEDADGTEDGAEEHRLKSDTITGEVYQVLAYVLPYLLKGLTRTGDKRAQDFTKDDNGNETTTTIEEEASKADTWRSAWSIPSNRAFKIGVEMPSTELWREYRRIKADQYSTDGNGNLTKLHSAKLGVNGELARLALAGDFAKFAKLAIESGAKILREPLLNDKGLELVKKNRYGEEVRPAISGITSTAGEVETRTLIWTKSEAISLKGEQIESVPGQITDRGYIESGQRIASAIPYSYRSIEHAIDLTEWQPLPPKSLNNVINQLVTVIEAQPSNTQTQIEKQQAWRSKFKPIEIDPILAKRRADLESGKARLWMPLEKADPNSELNPLPLWTQSLATLRESRK